MAKVSSFFRITLAAAALSSLGAVGVNADTASLRLRIVVPTICVAQETLRSTSAVELAVFCNNASGGDLLAHGSIEGRAVTLSHQGRRIQVNAGDSRKILSRTGAFRERVVLQIDSSVAPPEQIALFFQVRPR